MDCSNAQALRLRQQYPQLHVQTPTTFLLSLHTRLRHRASDMPTFVHNADMIIQSLVAEAIAILPHQAVTVTTPTGDAFQGVQRSEKLVGVSIMRAGESMEGGLRAAAPDATIGKLLIQRDEASADKRAQLMYTKLPQDIAEAQVLLLDPMLATGGSAIAAIQALLDSNVPQQRIVFVCLIAAPEGIERVLSRFPQIRMIASMIDAQLNEQKYILPGVGDFGDRYFGTTALASNL